MIEFTIIKEVTVIATGLVETGFVIEKLLKL